MSSAKELRFSSQVGEPANGIEKTGRVTHGKWAGLSEGEEARLVVELLQPAPQTFLVGSPQLWVRPDCVAR